MKSQLSFWYKEHQVLITPIEQTLRDPNVYSLMIWVYTPNRTTVLEDFINTDEVFWKGFDRPDHIVDYYTRWIDNNGDWSEFDDIGLWDEI